MKILLFSIDLWHVYWPVFQTVFWLLTAGFVRVSHIFTLYGMLVLKWNRYYYNLQDILLDFPDVILSIDTKIICYRDMMNKHGIKWSQQLEIWAVFTLVGIYEDCILNQFDMIWNASCHVLQMSNMNPSRKLYFIIIMGIVLAVIDKLLQNEVYMELIQFQIHN